MRRTYAFFVLGIVALVIGGAARAPIVRADLSLSSQVFLPLLQNPSISLQTEQQRQQAEEVVRLVNQERTTAGCPALSIDLHLVQAAQAHSTDMAVHNYFSHVGRDGSSFMKRLEAAGFTGIPGGENIAAGYATPTLVMAAWMTSTGHQANILNCNFRTIGVGYATDDASEYFSYWTQAFGQ